MKRTILITGATSGIGRACAEAFAAKGDRIIINGRREERLQTLQEDLVSRWNAEVHPLPFDVRKKEAVMEAIHDLPDEWGKVDILINNAGLALGKKPFDEAHIHDWETMIDTNISGLLYVTKAVLPVMIERRQGHIINIGSISGDDVYPGGNVYCATKSAVEAASKAMRIDLLPYRIKVSLIKPGAAETEFSNVRFKGDDDTANKVYEGMEPLSGKDVADAILYAASLPPHVCINSLTITPTAQANGLHVYREST